MYHGHAGVSCTDLAGALRPTGAADEQAGVSCTDLAGALRPAGAADEKAGVGASVAAADVGHLQARGATCARLLVVGTVRQQLVVPA